MKQSLSQYGYFCPVSWKVNKRFVNCVHNPNLCVLYKHDFYYFNTDKERQMFLDNPAKFTEKVLFSGARNCPMRLRPHKASEIIAQEKTLQGYCPVTLVDEERVQKGDQILVVQFKDNRYIMASEEKLKKFFENPSRYANAQLPVKMPAAVDSVHLF